VSHPLEARFGEIASLIRSQAAGRSLEEIRDAVAERYATAFAAVRALPEGALTRPVAVGEWSPLEAMKHLVEWNWQVGEDILHACLTGERPGNPPPTFDIPLEALIAKANESLESVWAHVSAADPQGFLDVKWEHPFFGQLNWREWFFFLGLHAVDHTRQVGASGATRA